MSVFFYVSVVSLLTSVYRSMYLVLLPLLFGYVTLSVLMGGVA